MAPYGPMGSMGPKCLLGPFKALWAHGPSALKCLQGPMGPMGPWDKCPQGPSRPYGPMGPPLSAYKALYGPMRPEILVKG